MNLSTQRGVLSSPPRSAVRRPLMRGAAMLLALPVALLSAPLYALDEGHDHGSGGDHPITTSSEEAQHLFNRGLELAWGFNHLEAARAFRQATQKDPECAMCWWGVALVLGPNINAPLDPQYYPEILQALARAKELAPKVSEREQAYIRALDERYGPQPVDDRSAYDRAYAKAMRRLAHRYADDLDAATLFAEALMDTMPWDYWTADLEPKPATREFLDALESVLKRNAKHAGANHLLIHTVEKARPDLGVPAAERLEKEAQATGHLVHMASHIYIRVGRYEDAARVNAMAIADDDAYAREHETPAEYVPYMLHNHHMRWAALTFDGRAEESSREAHYLAEHAPVEAMQNPVWGPFIQHLLMMPLFDDVRFGRWQEVLASPQPPVELLYPQALWHFGRGVALVRLERTGEAETELAALRALLADPRLAEAAVNFNPVTDLLSIAADTLAGEVAGAHGDWAAGERHLRAAVKREDALTYDEPPPWLPPARHWLGGVLLAAGRPAEAEKVYREDLDIYPRNGWSLAGLAKSLEAQGKDAASVRAGLAEATARADVKITASSL